MFSFNSQFTQTSHCINHPVKNQNSVQCHTEQRRGQPTLCKDWTVAQSCKIGEAASLEPISDCTD